MPRAVRDFRRRRCCWPLAVFLPFLAEAFSSLTTLSMRRRGPLSQPASRLGRGYTLVRVPRTWPLLLALLAALVFPAGAFASLSSSLKKQIRAAGHYSGAMVVDADSGKTL